MYALISISNGQSSLLLWDVELQCRMRATGHGVNQNEGWEGCCPKLSSRTRGGEFGGVNAWGWGCAAAQRRNTASQWRLLGGSRIRLLEDAFLALNARLSRRLVGKQQARNWTLVCSLCPLKSIGMKQCCGSFVFWESLS